MRLPSSLFVTLIIVLFGFNYACAQYNTDFEAEVFKNFNEQKDRNNNYDLLHAINYNKALYLKGEKLLESHINKLKLKVGKKSLKKQIQVIYKTTHSFFLRKYEADAYFNQIFDDGTYNCVSATALYALILDEFNINYAIKETPTHVYLIADTLGLQTMLESTLPGSGVMIYNESFKKEFVEYLKSNKLVSEEEWNNNSTQVLFRRYYQNDNSIGLRELAGIQYYNQGVFLMSENEYQKAIKPLNKASLLYNSNSLEYAHYLSSRNALFNDFELKKYDGNLLGQLIESGRNDAVLMELVTSYFVDISIILCVESPDLARYEVFYSDLSSQVKKSIPNEIRSKYYYYKAYHHKASGNLPVAMKDIMDAYQFDKNNLFVQDLAKEISAKKLYSIKSNRNRLDSLEQYFEGLPFLLENNLFLDEYVFLCMKITAEYFSLDNAEEGEKYFQRFLNSVDRYGIKSFNEDHIALGFLSKAIQYRKKNDLAKAEEVIDFALEFAPESFKLMKIKSELVKEKNAHRSRKNYKVHSPDLEVMLKRAEIKKIESLSDKVYRLFPKNWKAISIVMEDMEQDLNEKEVFRLIAKKNKDCTYIHNGKEEKGKWAYRTKSKCIYFVPEHDKDQYKVFKVKEISENSLVLLPYKDQKRPSPYKYKLIAEKSQ